MLEPPAGGSAFQALVAERPVALPLKQRGGAMSTVDEYHKYARDCLRWAARARTEEQRKQFLSLAQDWTQAASGLEGVQVPPQRVAPPQQDAAKAD
jgi:hypothetical protein